MSQYWEGQFVWTTVWDGPVQFLFYNTGEVYYGHGFETVAVLEANLCPNTFSAAFATLLSLGCYLVKKHANKKAVTLPHSYTPRSWK